VGAGRGTSTHTLRHRSCALGSNHATRHSSLELLLGSKGVEDLSGGKTRLPRHHHQQRTTSVTHHARWALHRALRGETVPGHAETLQLPAHTHKRCCRRVGSGGACTTTAAGLHRTCSSDVWDRLYSMIPSRSFTLSMEANMADMGMLWGGMEKYSLLPCLLPPPPPHKGTQGRRKNIHW
jgi:hypothetical protein